MTIYDCFMFNNELDVLEIRLRELDRVVDRFVLVEAAETHTGLAKALHFAENRERFRPWLDRILQITLKRLPAGEDAWVKENAQRNMLTRGLQDLADDDLVIISDVDEIPRASAVREAVKAQEIAVFGFSLAHFQMRLNYVQITGDDPIFVWPVAVRGALARSTTPQKLRDYRIHLQKRQARGPLRPDERVLYHAGWHFSYIGDDSHIRQKLKSFAHRELADPDSLKAHDVEELIEGRMDLFDRPGHRWGVARINGYFPEAVTTDPARFTHHILPDPDVEIDPRLSRDPRFLAFRRLDEQQ